MKFSTLRRALVAASVPAILLGMSTPADAIQSVGLVDVVSVGASGTARGDCAYTATLPSTRGFNYISVAFSGTARATSSRPDVVAVSTSIQCYLRYNAWGQAGITMPGPAAATAGTGEVYRLAVDPEICAVVSAAFSDGSVAPPTTRCRDL